MGGHTEHCFLGDKVHLPGHDDNHLNNPLAADNPFLFPNGLSLTYGQISMLGGDFCGTLTPICKGQTPEEQKQLFRKAYVTLAEGEDNRRRVEQLLPLLQLEHDEIYKALNDGSSTADAYRRVQDKTFQFDKITKSSGSGAAYLDLAEINLDHFGLNARAAYNAGHSVALDTAWQGDLKTAYMMNAFADHFLEDLFASGHMRVPREELSGSTLLNMCAIFMHDEDNVSGMDVWTPDKSTRWRAYGDFKLFEKQNKMNLDQMFLALNASVREVFDAYEAVKSGMKRPDVNPHVYPDYEAWQYAPTPECWSSTTGNTSPLFVVRDRIAYRRKNLCSLDELEYVPVLAQPSWWRTSWPRIPEGLLHYLCWGCLVWRLVPNGEANRLLVSWLRAHGVPNILLQLAGLESW